MLLSFGTGDGGINQPSIVGSPLPLGGGGPLPLGGGGPLPLGGGGPLPLPLGGGGGN